MLIEYKIEVMLPDEDPDPNDYVTEIRGTIFIFQRDDEGFETEDQIEVGEVVAYYADLWRARMAGLDVFEVFDAASETGTLTYMTLWDQEIEDFKESLIGGMSGLNALLLERIRIRPEFRGRRLALAATRITIDHFARDCALVALKPYPLDVAEDAPEVEIREAIAGLTAYYARLGFFTVPGSELMVLDLDRIHPSLQEAGYEG